MNAFHPKQLLCGGHRRGRAGRHRAGGRHLRRRRDLPLPDLLEVGGRLQDADRHRPQLSVDRLGRRHQADQGQDRHLRRLRHAAEARGAQGVGPGAVPDDHRRRGAGGERQGRAARAAGARRRHGRRDLPGRDHQVERRRASRSSTRSWRCRTRRSRRCTARTARAPTSCSPTTCPSRARSSRTRSAPTPRCSGRSASAPRATRASPT